MNRTLLLLNALALAALAVLIVQPQSAAVPSQARPTLALHTQQAVYATPAGKAPAVIQPSSRLTF